MISFWGGGDPEHRKLGSFIDHEERLETCLCTHTYICLCINKNIRIHSEHGDTIAEESCHDHDISKYSVLFMYFIDLILIFIPEKVLEGTLRAWVSALDYSLA